MKKIAALLLTVSMACNAFTTPLAIERDPKMQWYRCLYLENCVYRLNDLKEVCDAHGWDEHSSLEIEEIIESMKHNLGFPEE